MDLRVRKSPCLSRFPTATSSTRSIPWRHCSIFSPDRTMSFSTRVTSILLAGSTACIRQAAFLSPIAQRTMNHQRSLAPGKSTPGGSPVQADNHPPARLSQPQTLPRHDAAGELHRTGDRQRKFWYSSPTTSCCRQSWIALSTITNNAGRSNCSSNGSNRTCTSKPSSAAPGMP